MLESVQAMSLLTIMEIVGPLLLAAALIFATVQWSRQRTRRMDALGQRATRELYRKAAREESTEPDMPTPDAPPDLRIPTKQM
jgi:hypothetical protein